jgi:hypothetical protein
MIHTWQHYIITVKLHTNKMIGIKHTGNLRDFINNLPLYSWLYKTYNEKICFIIPDTGKFVKAEAVIRLQPFTGDYQYILADEIEMFKPGGTFSQYYDNKPNVEEDKDFVLDLGLEFNTDATKIICTYDLGNYLPSFEWVDPNNDYLVSLRELAYAKERHLDSSYFAAFLNQAKIPYYLYLKNDIEDFEKYYKNAPVLDIRGFNDNDKIISIYDKIFFK